MMSKTKLTIFQINDSHGYLEPHHEVMWNASKPRSVVLGGYARIATIFRKAREENPDAVIALDNGDTFHGTYPAVKSKGSALISLLNALLLDAMTGHWDFAYGPDHLRELTAKLNFPFLAMNSYDKQNGKPAFPSHRIVERAGLKVAVIGIAALVDKMMPPEFSAGLNFTLGDEELPDLIKKLREFDKVDLIVVLSHLGFPQDVKLAQKVSDIDILLSGHTHNRLHEPVYMNGSIIIQSGCHGSFVGRLDLQLEGRKILSCQHQLIAVDESIDPDAEMQAMVETVLAPHRLFLDKVVGSTGTLLHRNTMLGAPMDQFLLCAIAEAADTKIAFSNGWRYGAPIPPGPITINDLWNIIPTDPPVSTVEMKGEELFQMIEENLENVFAADPFKQIGGYVKRCLGVNITIKIENPKGHRIQRFFVEGELLDQNRLYKAAFVTSQGVPIKFGIDRVDLPISAIEACEQWLGTRPDFSLIEDNTIIAT